MSRQLMSEWSQSLRRLAQEKVTTCDKSTIVNALRTWNEFEEHLALREDLYPRRQSMSTLFFMMGLKRR